MLTASAIQAFRSRLDGDVVLPADADYDREIGRAHV